jgi:hypothetical protein
MKGEPIGDAVLILRLFYCNEMHTNLSVVYIIREEKSEITRRRNKKKNYKILYFFYRSKKHRDLSVSINFHILLHLLDLLL